jgi:hypothetical protein
MYLQRMQASVTTYVIAIGYPSELYEPSVVFGRKINMSMVSATREHDEMLPGGP